MAVMKAAIKVDTIKCVFIISYLLIVLSAVNAWATGSKKKGCGESPFETNLVKFEKVEKCYEVLLEVSAKEKATFDLSHVNFDFGCGIISNEWNSEGWKMETNRLDPTTRMGGIKIDDIPSFGKDENFKSFQVSFTFCPSEDCEDTNLQTTVAYKAGKCIYYDNASNDHDHKDCDKNDHRECKDRSTDDDEKVKSDCDGKDKDTGGDKKSKSGKDNRKDKDNCDKKNKGAKNDKKDRYECDDKNKSAKNDKKDKNTCNEKNKSTKEDRKDKDKKSKSTKNDGKDKNDCDGKDNNASEENDSADEVIGDGGDNGGENNGGGHDDGTVTDNDGAEVDTPNEPGETDGEEPECICNDNSSDPDGGMGDGITFSVTAETINPNCHGENTGSINLNILGGLEPYVVIWNTGDTDTHLQGIPAGVYTYTVTDANREVHTGQANLEETGSIVIGTRLQKPICSGQNNGSIELVISGGKSPYTFLWDNGSTEQTLTDLHANTYTVTVTDSYGCSETLTIPLFNETTLLANADILQPSCQDGTLGSITINPTGGFGPYNYAWSGGQTSQSIDGLNDGNYEVTVTDQNGCSYVGFYPVETDQGIGASAVITQTNCFNDSVGAIDLSIEGGTGPYDVVWSNTATTEDIANLKSGTYVATITDAAGCTITYKAAVSEDDIAIGYEGITIPSCNGSTNGGIAISISNAEQPYTIEWSNGSTDEDLINLGAGTYSVLVRDNAGCESTKSFTLPEPEPIAINHSLNVDACTGTQNISISATGGSMVYDYLWSDGSTGSTLENASPGLHTVTLTDTRECTVSEDITIESVPTYDFFCLIDEPETEILCGTDNNILTSAVTGATSYAWTVTSSDQSWAISSGADQASIEYLAGTSGSRATFVLSVTFEGGCVLTCEQTIEACIGDEPSTQEPVDEPCICPPITESTIDENTELADNESDHESIEDESDVTSSTGNEENNPGTNEENNSDLDDEVAENDEHTDSEEVENDDAQDIEVSTYPNPTCDYVKLDLRNCDKSALYKVDIFDFNGEKTCSYMLDRKMKKEYLVDLRSKKQGFYLVRVSNNKGWRTTKRIIKH